VNVGIKKKELKTVRSEKKEITTVKEEIEGRLSQFVDKFSEELVWYKRHIFNISCQKKH